MKCSRILAVATCATLVSVVTILTKSDIAASLKKTCNKIAQCAEKGYDRHRFHTIVK